MIPSIPSRPAMDWAYRAYIFCFFIFLTIPLIVVAAFAFNDSLFPSLPWKGFTLEWFFGNEKPKLGLFHEGKILGSIVTSTIVAATVSVATIAIGTCNAFLFNRYNFWGKEALYVFMLLPLVIPGIVLGISILVFSSNVANSAWDIAGLDLEFLRPGLPLVIIGQFSFIVTISTLIISARLKGFDRSLEEAALNLGASSLVAIRTITFPYLTPALIGAFAVSFLMSFENFNTTLMLVGSDAPLTITMFDRLKEGSTPVLNAVSLLLMVGSSVLALIMIAFQKKE